MGLFDKLFKKKEDVPEAKNAAKAKEEKPSISEEEASELLQERFEGVAPIESGRNQEICNKFVAKGIIDYKNGSFDEAALSELTFDELCLVYNSIGQLIERTAPHLKGIAALYKKFLRKKLLAKLSTFPVYTENAKVSNLPCIPYPTQAPSLLLYTDRKMAELKVSETTESFGGLDWTEVFEITPENFDNNLGEYFCTGYKTVYVNGKTKVKIEDVFNAKPLDAYGHTCVESCRRMIAYNQWLVIMQSRAKSRDGNMTENEINLVNALYYDASFSLWEDSLCFGVQLPAGIENMSQQDAHAALATLFKDGNIPTMTASFEDGQNYICLFTDLWAVQKYYKEKGYFTTLTLTESKYDELKNDNTIAGFLINPGRERFVLSKKILNESSTKGEKPSISEEEASELLQERFEGYAPIESGRNQEIFNEFVAKGITDYDKGLFNKTAVSELTFDELCLIYNEIGQFVEKNASHLTHIKESAALYKKFLRKKILERLSTFPVYTINAKVTNTPCAFHPLQGPSSLLGTELGLSLLLYTSKKAAELECSAIHKVHDWVEIFEITPENFDDVFGEYFWTGYKTVYINGKTQVKIEDVFNAKSLDEYGHTCVESCSKMIAYKQMQAYIPSAAKAGLPSPVGPSFEQPYLFSLYHSAAVSLWEDSLYLTAKLPAELEPLRQRGAPIPVTSLFKDGHFPRLFYHSEDGRNNYLCLFTDPWAAQKFYGKEAHVVTLSVTTKSGYHEIADEKTITGILVNPGRENFVLSKDMMIGM